MNISCIYYICHLFIRKNASSKSSLQTDQVYAASYLHAASHPDWLAATFFAATSSSGYRPLDNWLLVVSVRTEYSDLLLINECVVLFWI